MDFWGTKKLEEEIRSMKTQYEIKDKEFQNLLRNYNEVSKRLGEIMERIEEGGRGVPAAMGGLSGANDFFFPLYFDKVAGSSKRHNASKERASEKADGFAEYKDKIAIRNAVVQFAIEEGFAESLTPISIEASTRIWLGEPFSDAIRNARRSCRDILDVYNSPQINAGVRDIYQKLGINF